MADIPPGVDVFESTQANLNAATFVTFSLAAAAVGLRFGSRWLSQQRRGWDDWAILVALAFSFLLLVNMVSWIGEGFGKHYELFGPAVFPGFFRHLMLADILYALIQVAVKISMLLFYDRKFKAAGLRMPMLWLTKFMVLWLVAAVVVAATQCDPSADECGISSHGFPIGTWVPDVLTTVLVIILPLWFIDHSQLAQTQRILLYVAFGAGALVCAASAVRLVSLLVQDDDDMDFTWNLVSFGVWTMVESNIAIVAACLPTFTPIWNATVEPLYSKPQGDAPSTPIKEKLRITRLKLAEPSTPISPDTPGTGTFAYRDSSDLESRMSESDSDEEV